MKIIDSIKFDKPTNILNDKDKEEGEELCELFEGDITVKEYNGNRSFMQFYIEVMNKKAIKKYLEDNADTPYKLNAEGECINFEITFDMKDNFIERAVDMANACLIDDIIDAEEGDSIETEDCVFTLTEEDALPRLEKLLKEYSLTISGSAYDSDDSLDDLKLQQSFIIEKDGKIYKTAKELPDERDTIVLSSFFQFVEEVYVDIITECDIYDMLLEVFDNVGYIQDYSYVNNNGKKLEDTDFYKWFEENKILISEDKQYWTVDK